MENKIEQTQTVTNRFDEPCCWDGCTKVVGLHGARGYCSGHYRNVKRNTPELLQPKKTGLRLTTGPSDDGTINPTKHARYPYWRRLSRIKRICAEWADSFPTYLAECSPPSSEWSRLTPIDGDVAGPDNYKWVEIMDDEERRKQAKLNGRKANLSNNYGMTPQQYQTKHEAQCGLCAICGNPERIPDRKGGVRVLAVDHCHNTGLTRDLLCFCCNTALGRFNDDPDLMLKAAMYIERHRGRMQAH